jgi:AraC-like DNA-binding protein
MINMISKSAGSKQTVGSSWDFLKVFEAFPSQGLRHVALPSGIELLFLDFEPEAAVEHVFSIDRAPLQFAFHLSGRGRGDITHSLTRREVIDAGPGRALISYNPESTCKTAMPAQQSIRIFNVYIPPGLLYTLLNEELDHLPRGLHAVLEDAGPTPYNHLFNMTSTSRLVLDQIYNCPYRGSLGRLYLESKTMELIVLQLWEAVRGPVKRHEWRLRPSDVERIHAARDLLVENLENPPSLPELARKAGLNDTKLKRGFQQVFGTTICKYVRDCRLDKSKEILGKGELNITETAHLLGFYDVTHFIKNFKDRFGTTPGEYLKSSRR